MIGPNQSRKPTVPSVGTLVHITGDRIRFPQVCPHCLAAGTVPLRVEYRRMAAYFIVGKVSRYHTISAPFCASFANRVVWVHRVFNICMVLLFVVAIAAIALSDISRGQVWLLVLLILGGPCLAGLYWNPHRYLKITGVRADGIDFWAASPEYADTLRRLNPTKGA